MQGVARSRDGIAVHFEVEGTDPRSLVFVHGWSCDRRYWAPQMDALSAQYRVVAIDLAGHGESEAGRDSWTMSAFGGDVAAVVEHLDLNDVVLVGHSMGGDVIVEAAALLGERVAGLVWVDTYASLGKPRTREVIENFAEPFRRDFVGATRSLVSQMFLPTSDPELVEWVAADMSAAPAEIAIDALVHSISNDRPILDKLRTLSAPVVSINPDNRPVDIDALTRHGVRGVIMPGIGHFPMLEDPDRFNRLLDEIVHERFHDDGKVETR